MPDWHTNSGRCRRALASALFRKTELAAAAGLACENGIVVDEQCCTSDPNIYAAGDCTYHPSLRYGDRIRLGVGRQRYGTSACRRRTNICGNDLCNTDPLPWFWSDQYEVKLQTAGLMHLHNSQVVRGDPASGQFSATGMLKNGVVHAVDAINRPGDFMTGKRWIAEHKHPDIVKLCDAAVDLKTL